MSERTRRELLLAAAAGLTAAALPAVSGGPKPNRPHGKTLLILGGTAFLGPELVAAARKDAYTVTLFNRGKTNPQLFPDLEKLRGDRNGDLSALKGRTWDAVIDTSGYFPRQVRLSASLLAKSVSRYVFISSISVFSDTAKPGLDENGPVYPISDADAEKAADENKVRGESYGALKAACERAAEKALPGRALNIRPGLIVGPGDGTDRFTYWPVRVARGGDVLCPGDPKDPVQFIDVRDLAEWIIRMLDGGGSGVFTATGPRDVLSIGELLGICQTVSGSDARLTWADAAFLEEQKVSAWGDMPCWLPPTGETAGANAISNKKAVGAGLTFRPLAGTVKDTLEYFRTLPPERQKKPRAGIAPEREAEVLKALRERKVKTS